MEYHMDIATFIGILFGIASIIIPIALGGQVIAFFDIKSIFIVVGGGIASTLISYRVNEVSKIIKVAVNAFKGKAVEAQDTIALLVELSQKARRDGLLSLESEYERITDQYLEESLQLVVDGVEPEIIIDSMDLELENMRTRHERGQGLFKTLGVMFPAWGMIGTLMGLIMLLKSLNDHFKTPPLA